MKYEELKAVFEEIEPGFSPQEAATEASRCLKCKEAPCSTACPADIDVAKFIRQIASRNLTGAIKVIKEDNILAGCCARVCPQAVLCEGACSSTDLSEPIKIGLLQRFAADQEYIKGPKALKSMPPKNIKTAVIGAGPAGLSAAAFLKRLGYDVDVHEAQSYPGGFLNTGIPAFRLPKEVIRRETEFIQALGVNIIYSSPNGDPAAMLADYEAVFVGAGAGRPYRLGLAGEDADGVIQALDLLRAVGEALWHKQDLDFPLGDKVVVIGGGNAAMDAAATAVKLGVQDVTVLYRRTEEEMPAWEEERAFVLSLGATFKTLSAPVEFLNEDGKLVELKCLEMELGDLDESKRRRPVPIPDGEFTIKCDMAIVAVSQGPSFEAPGLDRDRQGLVIVDAEKFSTNVEGVFAGGDLIRGSDMAVSAVGDGKKAAFAMDARLKKKK